ncbi:MAG: hypothetical protein ACU0BB_08475 [Paracoccaceae bacterium]|jgi:urocanate hydratase
MLNRFKRFFRRDEGAVTVDWVVLTAAVVGLAGAAIMSIQDATGGVGSSTGAAIGAIQVE